MGPSHAMDSTLQENNCSTPYRQKWTQTLYVLNNYDLCLLWADLYAIRLL